MKQYKFKKVIVHKTSYGYELCHTLGGILNPFFEFDTEQEARDYAAENNLTCKKDVYEGEISEWQR